MSNLHEEILEILSNDSRTLPGEIAVQLGVDETVVTAAIAQMERDNIIVKYNTVINTDKTASSSEIQVLSDNTRSDKGASVSRAWSKSASNRSRMPTKSMAR